MSELKCYAVLLTASLLAGCASAPQQSVENRGVAQPAESAVDGAESVQVIERNVINLNAIVNDAGRTVVCRDMLKQGSNVIATTCMTRDDWVRFQRRQEAEARAFVRVLQGGAYR
jgi:PBP1b-binding outer membrane lipoprotein LpoB